MLLVLLILVFTDSFFCRLESVVVRSSLGDPQFLGVAPRN